ncbi:MAG: formylglycine-generating enzyme family protein [Acidobacteria bacterium]|nr:formylglycine-generating enzyme family protein [Acidobacteriota bacterium]
MTRRSLLQGALATAAAVAAAAKPVSVTQAPTPLTFRGRNAGEERDVDGIRLCWCPPGRFVMGSSPTETGHRSDEAQTDVTLTKGFWISKFEATQGNWRRVVGEFPDKKPAPHWGAGDELPVYWVNFTESEAFCTALTKRAHASDALAGDWAFRLPTEAQWEYACRAGTSTATSFGNQLGRHHANFAGQPLAGGSDGPALRRASRVGSYPANPWGICDMHGNIFEWCRDWYHARLPGGIDPDLREVQGTPNRDGTHSRVRRGGAWDDDGWACRSALRLRYEPERRADHIGFRVVAVQVEAAASPRASR